MTFLKKNKKSSIMYRGQILFVLFDYIVLDEELTKLTDILRTQILQWIENSGSENDYNTVVLINT